jgi:hypothetical protein
MMTAGEAVIGAPFRAFCVATARTAVRTGIPLTAGKYGFFGAIRTINTLGTRSHPERGANASFVPFRVHEEANQANWESLGPELRTRHTEAGWHAPLSHWKR